MGDKTIMYKWFMRCFLCLAMLLQSAPSFAAHPLISDDAGTQGTGNFQLELNGQYDWDRENEGGVTIKTTGGQASSTLSYGVAENVDLVLSLPYLWVKTKEEDSTVYDENGIGDMVFETKWRFKETGGFSFALKPGVIIPTGNDEKGLGAGQLGGQLFMVASKDLASFAFHANLGYIRNENKADERKDLWHASLASTWEAVKDLKLVANIGMERNPDDDADDDPAFLIGGLIYSIKENLDVDFGVKCGLTSSETDVSLMAGMALRF